MLKMNTFNVVSCQAILDKCNTSFVPFKLHMDTELLCHDGFGATYAKIYVICGILIHIIVIAGDLDQSF